MPWVEPILYYTNYPNVNNFWSRIKEEKGVQEFPEIAKVDVTEEEKICLQ